MGEDIPIRSMPPIRRRESSQFVKHKDYQHTWMKRTRRSLNKCDCSDLALVDRISELPCEVLFKLLSLLPLKEAAATSILSRRWRHLWESTTKLDFAARNYLPGINDQDFVLNFMHLEEKLKDELMDSYVNWVNRVVERHCGSKIQQFKACFFLGLRHSTTIDEWIQFAVEKNVEILELDLSPGATFPLDSRNAIPPCYRKDGYSQYLLCPVKHSASGKQFSDIPNPSTFISSNDFKSLKVLHLRNVGVTGEVLEYFLSKCPVLERLSVTVSKNLVSLRVVGPTIALKYLMIENCFYMKSVEVRDVNIVSFGYIGDKMIEVLLCNLPMLVDVSLVKRLYVSVCVSIAFRQLSCYVSQIQYLTLDIKGQYEDLTIPTLANLKCLDLTVCAQYVCSLQQLSSFLMAAPFLPRLVLKLAYMIRKEPGEIEEVIECHHHNLKDVEIIGYRGITCAIQHVNYLVQNAVALEKIVINSTQIRLLAPSVEREIEQSKVEEKARNHAKYHLIPTLNVPSTIEFVCL